MGAINLNSIQWTTPSPDLTITSRKSASESRASPYSKSRRCHTAWYPMPSRHGNDSCRNINCAEIKWHRDGMYVIDKYQELTSSLHSMNKPTPHRNRTEFHSYHSFLVYVGCLDNSFVPRGRTVRHFIQIKAPVFCWLSKRHAILRDKIWAGEIPNHSCWR